MTVYIVYMVFIIFVIILLIISCYFLTALGLRKYNESKIEEKKQEIFTLFKKVLNSDTRGLRTDKERLSNHFKGKRGVEAFYLAYVSYVEEYGYSLELRDLLNQVTDYKVIVDSTMIIRSSYRKSYALYLISEFRLNEKAIEEFAIDALDEDSIYTRHSALNVIRNQGEIASMLGALDTINKSDKHYNEKIIIDFLDNFSGDKRALDHEILEKIDGYKEILKNIVIEHLTNIKNDCLAVRNKMLGYLQIPSSTNVTIKSMNYFLIIKDTRAAKYILKNMESENWSLRAKSAQTIFMYPDAQVIEKLTQLLTDPNYFVRKNSANSLVKIQDKESIFSQALNNPDQFARDILVYTIETSGLSGFSAFKEEGLDQ